jgi:hypothetical protein
MFIKRIALMASLVALCPALYACDTTADKQRKADQAQLEANQERAAAEEHARQQSAEAQNAAQQQASQEQRKADRAQNAAYAELGQEEGAYSSKLNDVIDDLNGKVNELEAAAAAEQKASKREEDSQVLRDAVDHRETLTADARAVPYATTMSWPDLKAKIEKDLEDARPVARSAAAHIRSSPR